MIQQLRDATKQSHQQLDHAVYPIIQGVRNTQDYHYLLLTFYGYFQPVYHQIDEYIDDAVIVDYSTRRKPERMMDDLKTTGFVESSSYAKAAHIPQINDRASAMGALYVLEGSTMGGQIISKKIRENLDLENDDALSFFSGYGKETAARWKAFLEVLEKEASPAIVIESATATFELFGKWIAERYPSPHL